jgi:hypothetical protein
MLPVSLDCPFLVFLRLVYPMLSVSLECPLLMASSVFSNVYLFIGLILQLAGKCNNCVIKTLHTFNII